MARKKIQSPAGERKPIRDLAPRKVAETERRQVKGGKPNSGSLNFEHYFDKSSN